MNDVRKRTHLIAAVDANWGIGLKGTMAWHIPSELKHFKALTMSRIVIVGRRTADSLIVLKPELQEGVYSHSDQAVLPGRTLIVVTRREHTRDYTRLGLHVADSLEAAIAKAAELDSTSMVLIAGGGQLYKEALEKDLVEKLYISHLMDKFECDAFFPKPDSNIWMRRLGRSHSNFNEYVYTKRKTQNEPALYSS